MDSQSAQKLHILINMDTSRTFYGLPIAKNMQTDNNLINDDEMVTVYYSGKYREVICCRQVTKPIKTTKLSQLQYIDNDTNEVKNYQYSYSKSMENFKKGFKNVPRLIKGYFDGDSTEKFITLTYSSKMENPYRLPYDFKKFMQKLERRYCKCRYFYIKEPQENGSWHIHSLIKRLDQKPFNITIETVCALWSHGHEVAVKAPYNISTLPFYFDITRFENKISRLVYYPPYLKIYGHSKDMKIQRFRGRYKNFKPDNMVKTYSTENEYFIVNQKDGEVYNYWKTAYEQYMKP